MIIHPVVMCHHHNKLGNDWIEHASCFLMCQNVIQMSSNRIHMWTITTSWEMGDHDGGGHPKLKGARWFSFA